MEEVIEYVEDLISCHGLQINDDSVKFGEVDEMEREKRPNKVSMATLFFLEHFGLDLNGCCVQVHRLKDWQYP